MTDIINYLRTLFTAEGHHLSSVVLRWILLYILVLWVIYDIVGRLVLLQIARLERRAQRALNNGEPEEAVQAYSKTLALLSIFQDFYKGWARRQSRYNEGLGDAFFALQRYASAAHFYYRRLLQGMESTLDPGALAGNLYLYQLGLEVSHSEFDLLRKLGLSLLRAGCAEEAVIWLRRAVVAAPNNREAWLHLAEAYEQLGDKERAGTARLRAEEAVGDGPEGGATDDTA